MNKDRVMGVVDEVVGNTKSKAGKLTGNNRLQVEGMAQQVKGKVENAWGKTKDAVHEVVDGTEMHIDTWVELTSKDSNAGIDRNMSK
jgi:uncharacterized protein YjbJ (UPF0337 family)